MTNQQLPRHYLVLADAFILIYDTEKNNSLDVLVSLKKDIDKNKDKKEVGIQILTIDTFIKKIFVLGYNNSDSKQNQRDRK